MADNICGECKWHKCVQVGFITSDWYCENPDSDNCTMFTDYTDTCEEFEQRGIE